MSVRFVHAGGECALDRPIVMGVLNVTPDSFSDGGLYTDPARAAERARQIEREGAAILDIGAQSTRPGYTAASEDEEWERLCPVLTALSAWSEPQGRLSIPVSVDTFYPSVAKRALEKGAVIINDVSGRLDGGMLALAAQSGAGLVITYPGLPGGEQPAQDVVACAHAFFEQALQSAERAGLPWPRVCLDVGIGFGKTRQADLTLIAQLPRVLRGLPEVAVMVGASRKRVVAAYGAAKGADVPPPDRRLGGTIALHTAAVLGGAHILRAHDVYESVQAAAVAGALKHA